MAGGVARHQQNRYAEQDAAAQEQAYAQGAAAAAPKAASSGELIDKLKELAQLRDQGILTEDEFNNQKTKILNEMS